MYKLFQSDWDGTLVDSMGVKADSFTETLIAAVPALRTAANDIWQLYISTGGTPRREQARRALESNGLPAFDDAQFNAWSKSFTSHYSQTPAPLFPETEETLRTIKGRKYPTVLTSSVPQKDLTHTVAQYPELIGLFGLVLGERYGGKFHKGAPHTETSTLFYGVRKDQVLFVGDAAQDVQSGREAGTYTVIKVPHGRPTEAIEAVKPDRIIHTLNEILEYFPPR